MEVSVFVTRTQASATGLPGSRMGVLYQLASVPAVVKIEILVDGVVVAGKSATGPTDSLTEDLGNWFTTPASGRHTLAVRATNRAGCSRTGSLPTPFIVQ